MAMDHMSWVQTIPHRAVGIKHVDGRWQVLLKYSLTKSSCTSYTSQHNLNHAPSPQWLLKTHLQNYSIPSQTPRDMRYHLLLKNHSTSAHSRNTCLFVLLHGMCFPRYLGSGSLSSFQPQLKCLLPREVFSDFPLCTCLVPPHHPTYNYLPVTYHYLKLTLVFVSLHVYGLSPPSPPGLQCKLFQSISTTVYPGTRTRLATEKVCNKYWLHEGMDSCMLYVSSLSLPHFPDKDNLAQPSYLAKPVFEPKRSGSVSMLLTVTLDCLLAWTWLRKIFPAS